MPTRAGHWSSSKPMNVATASRHLQMPNILRRRGHPLLLRAWPRTALMPPLCSRAFAVPGSTSICCLPGAQRRTGIRHLCNSVTTRCDEVAVTSSCIEHARGLKGAHALQSSWNCVCSAEDFKLLLEPAGAQPRLNSHVGPCLLLVACCIAGH